METLKNISMKVVQKVPKIFVLEFVHQNLVHQTNPRFDEHIQEKTTQYEIG